MTAVDVVIPAFNAAAYLGEAIASVFAQTHPVARVIVVDDASVDATAAIAAAFGARVEVIRLYVNQGAAAARNAGLAVADAPLVAFLDADDRWLAGKLATQCAALDRDATTMFALCKVRVFASPDLPGAERAALAAAHASEFEGWNASALVARRELFTKVGVFDPALRIGETIDWFSRARAFAHVHVDSAGVERRLHRRNTTRLAGDDLRGYLATAHRHLARMRAQKAT